MLNTFLTKNGVTMVWLSTIEICFRNLIIVLAYLPFTQTCPLTFDEQQACVLENCCRGQKVKTAFQLEL